MAYSVYSFASQYTDTGWSGSTSARARRTWRAAWRSSPARSRDIAARQSARPRAERAKENLKGRIALSMESTSNRMSRLGRSLITDTELLSLDRIIAEIDAVEPVAVAELAGVLLEPGRISAAGIGPSEERFLEAVELVHPGSRRQHEGRPERPRGEGRLGARRRPGEAPATRCSASRSATSCRTGRGDGRLHAAGRGGRRTSRLRSSGGCPCVVGTSGWERERAGSTRCAKERGLAVFVAPNFSIGAVLMMRFAAEAAKHLPHAEIVELHNEAKKDAPSGTAQATADGMGGEPQIHSVRLPGSRRAPGGAARGRGAAADDPPRHAGAGGVRAGRAARAGAVAGSCRRG